MATTEDAAGIDLERLALEVGAQFVARVREETPGDNLAWLLSETTAEERDVLLWILAAAVPVDEPMRQLLAWCRPEVRAATWAEVKDAVMEEGGKQPLQPCGTWAAAKRHRYRKEPVCPSCRVAERGHMAAVREARERREGEEAAA
jgi:hypothetical protein